ncbi:MAG: tRNA (N6-threonylcarbamoyladenosine(37)-N6)-methyltransferase TrmO [Chloroflexota bacterium]|nr:tRNA (N6-threonylcarbamoyladenosine(37)-N6)-methyltransferase TrmO [Chloroflexota bacterium]
MIQLKPIGTIHNAVIEARRDTHWDEVESDIVVDDEWRAALDGVEQFSHIWVVFYFHRMPPPDSLRVHPMRQETLPRVGLFATRSPQRPNPIGIRAVELLHVRGTVLRVRGLDALDGTPVLDLKPYLARRDAIANTRVPEWARKIGQMSEYA